MRLTLRTLLAYVDDQLPAAEAKLMGQKIAESERAREMLEKVRRVTRRRGLSVPSGTGESAALSDANTVAEFLSDKLPEAALADFESLCLESDVHLAEVAACHQILSLVLSDPVRVPPTARQRMYQLVKGPESIPTRSPGTAVPIGGLPHDVDATEDHDADAAYLMGLRASNDDANAKVMRRIVVAALVLGLVVMTGLIWQDTSYAPPPSGGPRAAAQKPAEPKPEVKAEPKESKEPKASTEPKPLPPVHEEAPQPRPAP
jgi:hypothetical protein